MPEPSTPEARNLRCEAQALIEQAIVQQTESSASCIRHQSSKSSKLREDRFDCQSKYVNDLLKNFGMKMIYQSRHIWSQMDIFILMRKNFGSRHFYYGYY
jgi:hypothetical protein